VGFCASDKFLTQTQYAKTTKALMARSHKVDVKPSLLLAVVCCALIWRIRPQWLSISVQAAAAEAQCKPARISRLATRVIYRFEGVLIRLTRLGRPHKSARKAQVAATEANKLNTQLLAVASDILANIPRGRRPAHRALLLGAYHRLRVNYPELTQKRFCAAVGLPERTLRHWLKQPPADNKGRPHSPAPEPKPKRPMRRGRFGFAVTFPDTQIAGDTTDVTAFGVPLKIIATQDIGGRDQDLFESVIVDDHESAELVVKAFTEAIRQRPGMQAVVDQGTPYMADATRAALDDLDAEHAPQREGTPTAKATIERAFRSIKTIAGPLLDVSNRVAAAFPSLTSPSFAKAATTLLLTALLRAYQSGARAARRADDQRAFISTQDLASIAEKTREQVHAQNISARQTLTRIHTAYEMDVPLQKFIRAHRGFPLEVIREAERLFASQAHRDDIRKRTSYFAALLCKANQPHAARRRRIAEQNERKHHAERERQEIRGRDAHLKSKPTEWLHDAFKKLMMFWQPNPGNFLFGGVGPARAHVAGALMHLGALYGTPAALDMAYGVLADFTAKHGYDTRVTTAARASCTTFCHHREKFGPRNSTGQTHALYLLLSSPERARRRRFSCGLKRQDVGDHHR
jgi:transposase InsO family protein